MYDTKHLRSIAHFGALALMGACFASDGSAGASKDDPEAKPTVAPEPTRDDGVRDANVDKNDTGKVHLQEDLTHRQRMGLTQGDPERHVARNIPLDHPDAPPPGTPVALGDHTAIEAGYGSNDPVGDGHVGIGLVGGDSGNTGETSLGKAKGIDTESHGD